MLDLLQNYSMTEIAIFLIMIALAIKGVVDFYDWAKGRIKKPIDDACTEKEIKQKILDTLTSHNSQIDKMSKAIDILIESDKTTSPSDKTAISEVPPPISTTILPFGLTISIPAPIAAALGSSIKATYFAPALRAASSTAISSTSVTPEGTQIITRGLKNDDFITLFKKYLIIFSVVS